MNVKIGAEAALFPEKEYISGIFVAVQGPGGRCFRKISTVLLSSHITCFETTDLFLQQVQVHKA
jgi:hypothetical protein